MAVPLEEDRQAAVLMAVGAADPALPADQAGIVQGAEVVTVRRAVLIALDLTVPAEKVRIPA